MRWFPRESRESARPKQTSTVQEVLNIRQFLLDYQKQKELAEGIGIEEDDTEDLGNMKFVLWRNSIILFLHTASYIRFILSLGDRIYSMKNSNA